MKVEEIRHVKQPMALLLVIPICILVIIYAKTGTIGITGVLITTVLTILLFFAKREQDKLDVCITINDDGITDHRQKYGTILWKDVRRVYVFSYSNINASWLCIKLHNSNNYLRKLNPFLRFYYLLTQAMGMSTINFSTAGLDVDINRVYQIVMERCENYHLQNSSNMQ